MAVTGRTWYDFVIYTEKGLSVKRIPFDRDFRQFDLLPKLTDFYENCLAPEKVSLVHVLSMLVLDLPKM